MCMNCGLCAHEMCPEVLPFAILPNLDPLAIIIAISSSDLDSSGLARYSWLSDKERMKTVVCVLCHNRLKALKQRGGVLPCAPTKSTPKKRVKVCTGILQELHCLAAFQCQMFVFTYIEKTGKQQLIAQNEESAGQQDRNLKIVSLSKQIEAARDLIGFKEWMMSAMEMDMEEKPVVFKEIGDLMAKIGTLTE